MENRFRQLPQKHVIVVLTISVLVLVYIGYGVGHFGAQRHDWTMAAEVPIGRLEADERPIGFRLGIQIDLPASSSKQKFHVGMTKTVDRSTTLTTPPLAVDRKSLSRDGSEAGGEKQNVTNSSWETTSVADHRLIARDNEDDDDDDDEARQTVYRTYNKDTWTAKRKLPQALIIGVKKGGTRALLEFIRLHPDVRAVGPETHFFDRNYHKGLDWYRRHMPASLEGQITMEKTPSYFVTREVPRRVHNMSRDARLLVVVRDPVTRAISDYAQTMSKRNDLKPFEELAFRNNVTGLVDTSWAAIKLGVYAKHLERWLQYFPLRQFHFVSGERLIKDPAGEMTKVQDFLGIRRVITDDHFYFNETKGFPCLKKSERNGRPKCLGRTKGRPHPNIDSAAIQRLRDFYRPFNVKFYLMTGVNFEWP